ncbi:flagellar assembly protein FliH [Roseovarius nanhaiticus]|uniref:Flagellar assembly protein FliH n=2 Tax=Roseovarius nanhaiticus TaxID=573024 RepID=A0A1N7HL36_9RHOB|nr:flagellar biosynthesis protein [Roseovarius nanhaiticus]SEL27181.1 flagellar assembly protein FliH [Roseovarius nanhaiticus]SIS25567.1 flagellar assembly protein FliH [Roseovarius nanhaiticus]
MMSIAHLLEDFGTELGDISLTISDATLEQERIDAYENGYKAGWQDAVKAASEDADRVGSDFAGNLQDISFTLAEAQRDLLATLRPLLTGMVESVLPHLAHRTIGDHVVQTIERMAQTAMQGPLRLVTAPGNADALQTLIEDREMTDTTVEIEPSLGEGQIHIRATGSEQEIDLDAVLAQIDTALSGFFEEHQKDIA